MKRRKLISVVVLILLLFSLSIVAFAGGDGGPIRPQVNRSSGYEREPEYPIVSPCGGTEGTTRP